METTGYTDTRDKLIAQYDAGRLAHTLLVQGLPGWGALPMVLELASHILAQPSAPGLFGSTSLLDPRESKDKSQPPKITRLLDHPDLHISYPFINSSSSGSSTTDESIATWKAYVREHPYTNDLDWFHHLSSTLSGNRKNPTGNINKAECDNILKKLSLKAFGNNPKVLIIWYPEYLVKEGNRLLKTLEEPTDDTYIIMIAENSQNILRTIRSRCQTVQMRPWSDELIRSTLLRQHPQLSTDKLADAVRRAEGDMRRALQLAESDTSMESDAVLQWFRLCYADQIEELRKHTESFAAMSKDLQTEWMEYSLFFLAQILRQKSQPDYEMLLTAGEASSAKKLGQLLTLDTIDHMTILIEKAIVQIRRNANPRLLMMNISMLFHSLLRTGRLPEYSLTTTVQ